MKKLLAVGLFALSINCLGMDSQQELPALVERRELFNQQEYQIYCAARRLADLVFIAAIKLNENPEYPSILQYSDDRRQQEVSSLWYRTQQGLFLEFYYGNPTSIHTPWGKWNFNGSISSLSKYRDTNHPSSNALITLEDGYKFHEKALQQLGVELTLNVPGKLAKVGYVGPYYKVTSVEGHPLPDAVYDQGDLASWYATREVTTDKWKAMTERYNLEKK